VDPLRILAVERVIPKRAHVLKYCRATAVADPQLCFWDFESFDKTRPGLMRWVRWGLWIPFYRRALVDAFGTTERELSTLGFAARYPFWSAPS
jgi:hypothetical protein